MSKRTSRSSSPALQRGECSQLQPAAVDVRTNFTGVLGQRNGGLGGLRNLTMIGLKQVSQLIACVAMRPCGDQTYHNASIKWEQRKNLFRRRFDREELLAILAVKLTGGERSYRGKQRVSEMSFDVPSSSIRISINCNTLYLIFIFAYLKNNLTILISKKN
jgi:hypothetical protein